MRRSGIIGLAMLVAVGGPAFAHADILVSSFGSNEIKQYDSKTGAFLGNFMTAGSGGLDGPMGLAFGPDGNLFNNNQIVALRDQTFVIFATGGGLNSPTFLTADVPPQLAVPRPSSVVLLAVGLLGLAALWKRKNGAATPSPRTIVRSASA